MSDATTIPEIHKGLEGVYVDVTSTSFVDGDAGKLYYRGYSIEALVKYRFTEVAYLLTFGELPNAGTSKVSKAFSAAYRTAALGDCA